MFQYINELFENTKCYIYEFATSTENIKRKIEGLTHPIFEHILKIAYLNKQCPQTLEHWSGEIMNWIAQCFDTKLKSTNKRPTKEQIYKWMFSYCEDEEELFSEHLKILADYNVEINVNKSYKFLKKVVPVLLEKAINKPFNKQGIIETILSLKEQENG